MPRHSFRQLLLTAAAGCSALMMSTSPSYAQPKEPDVYFYPAKSWSLGKNGQSCLIQNEFNNGFVVAFSGTPQWVDSLNVNFRQAVFENNKVYNAVLSVPGQAQDIIRARANSPETLDLHLMGNKEIYKKIKESGVFDLNVEGNNFRFYLTGFPAVADDFERCMSGGAEKKPEAVREAVAPEQASPSAEKTTAQEAMPLIATSRNLSPGAKDTVFSNEAMALEQQVKSVNKKDRPRMSEQLSKEIIENPEIIEMDNEPALPRSVKDHQSSVSPAVKDQVSAAEPLSVPPAAIEKDSTPLKSPEPPAGVNAAQKLAPLPEKAAEASMQITQDIKAGASAPVSEMPVNEVEDIPPPPAQVEKTHVQSPPMKVQREVIKAEADFTNIEPAAKTGGMDRMPHSDSDALMAMVATLKRKVETLEAENRALNDDLEQSVSASEKERMQIASENWNLERATMQFNEAERQIKRLGQQLQTERAQCSVEKKELEAMLFDPKVTEDAQLARLADLETQLIATRAELKRLKGAQ